jgi:hypothetical protein
MAGADVAGGGATDGGAGVAPGAGAGCVGAGLAGDAGAAGLAAGVGAAAKNFGGSARHGSDLDCARGGALSVGILTALRVSGALRPSGTVSVGRDSVFAANGRSWQVAASLPP